LLTPDLVFQVRETIMRHLQDLRIYIVSDGAEKELVGLFGLHPRIASDRIFIIPFALESHLGMKIANRGNVFRFVIRLMDPCQGNFWLTTRTELMSQSTWQFGA
jgi:hypothetical protein